MAKYTYKFFDQQEDVVSGLPKTKTFPMWTDSPTDADTVPESILSEFWTQSAEVIAWEGNYYYNVFGEDTASNANAPVQFSVAFGTSQSIQLGTSETELQYTYPSKAVYRQFVNVLIGSSSEINFTRGDTIGANFDVGGSIKMPAIYSISVARARIKDAIDIDNWQLNISGSGGASGSLLTLINQTGSISGIDVLNIVTGELSDYTGNSSTANSSHVFGRFYPYKGVFILDASRIDDYIGSSSDFDLAAVTGAANYQPSGSLNNIWQYVDKGMYFRARTVEKVQSTHYFCRIKNYESNYSTNPTWVSGSDREILDDFLEDPKTFITTVGLYDGDGESGQLVAVAKLSRPIAKATDSEVLVKVQLSF